MGPVRWIVAFALVCAAAFFVDASDEARTVALPAAHRAGGKPLMQALAERRSSREVDGRALPSQTLSDLLWAAAGVNRADGRRTVPSALNWQEVEVYVATAEGAYRYDAAAHALVEVVAEDLRALTGRQDFVGSAPVNLVYVADRAKATTSRFPVSDEDKDAWAAVSAGCMCQNVYLFCASEGLSTVVRGLVPREDLSAKLRLRPDQRILLAQTVGFPKP